MSYRSPTVQDFGSLDELTASTHLLYGVRDHDLGFSGAMGGQPASAGSGTLPTSTAVSGVSPQSSIASPPHAGVLGTHAPGASHGQAGAGHGGGTGGGGSLPGLDRLPFTGFAAAATGALGAGLLAVGASLRRLSRIGGGTRRN